MSTSSRNKFTRVKTAKGRRKSSTAWLKRQLNDPYVQQAKAQGYRSRAVFKIEELDKRFHFLKANKIVVDLGAAPGGWSQYAVKKVGKGNVLAVDILDMEEIEGVKFIKQDFLAPDAHEVIINAINDGVTKDGNAKCDVLLSDMAANSCGDAKTDHIRIVSMLEDALDFAEKILNKDGCFVAKIFQGGAGGELLKRLKRDFTNVKHFKPDSSRKESAENYVVALGFKSQQNL
ncbi:MAG: RlmE family RNA methyltransferase [Proteobacteria bacterium]|nr:RlmE family RNA methyltransferase [Pseudomonadota bacterium]